MLRALQCDDEDGSDTPTTSEFVILPLLPSTAMASSSSVKGALGLGRGWGRNQGQGPVLRQCLGRDLVLGFS